MSLYKRFVLPVILCPSDASLIKVDDCYALGLIHLPAAILMQITGALVKFLICHSFLLSLEEELADLSLPQAFSPYP